MFKVISLFMTTLLLLPNGAFNFINSAVALSDNSLPTKEGCITYDESERTITSHNDDFYSSPIG